MSRSSLVFLLICLYMATSVAAEREDGFAVVYDGAVSMEKMPIKRGNLYPWLNASEIYIHSCGFAQITYNEADLVAFLSGDDKVATRTSSFYYLMGEWCEVADALLERSYRAAHVVSYRRWDGKKYLLSQADVYIDNEGAAYVADKNFVEANNLQPLVRPIAQGDANTGCFQHGRAPPETLDGPAGLVSVGDMRCATKGVPVKEFALRADKSLEGTRGR